MLFMSSSSLASANPMGTNGKRWFLSFLGHPIKGALFWLTIGAAISIVAPAYLHQFHFIFSTKILRTTIWCGTLFVLLPLGITRGIMTSIQETTNPQRIEQAMITIQQQLQSLSALTTSTASTTTTVSTTVSNPQQQQQLSATSQELLERIITFGSGWQGRLVRTLASPFLPSTTQMLVRLQEAMGKPTTSNSRDHHRQVLAAAISGFLEGYVHDKKDSITTLSLFLYLTILCIGFGIDYSYHKVHEQYSTTCSS